MLQLQIAEIEPRQHDHVRSKTIGFQFFRNEHAERKGKTEGVRRWQ